MSDSCSGVESQPELPPTIMALEGVGEDETKDEEEAREGGWVVVVVVVVTKEGDF